MKRLKPIACLQCAKIFSPSKSGRKFCCHRCSVDWTVEQTRIAREQTKCATDGCNRHVDYKGLCSRCHQRLSVERGKTSGKHGGICPTCAVAFRSSSKKTFCSLECYLKSDHSKAIMAEAREKSAAVRGVVIGERVEVACLECGRVRRLVPSRVKGSKVRQLECGERAIPVSQKFCCHACFRKWFAARFDRWVASPESIALPQCYDEFLSSAELPCLIDGCGWSGHQLATHMNHTHGMSRDEFKRMAGFNVGTGVISAPLQGVMAEIRQGNGNPNIASFSDPVAIRQPRGPARLEAMEHRAKSIAIRRKLNASTESA